MLTGVVGVVAPHLVEVAGTDGAAKEDGDVDSDVIGLDICPVGAGWVGIEAMELEVGLEKDCNP